MIYILFCVLLLLLANAIVTGIIWARLSKERKRNRIQQAFVAGLVRSISDFVSNTDAISPDEMPDRTTTLPIPYKTVLENVKYELMKNVYKDSPEAYDKWALQSRNLFVGERVGNDVRDDGFVYMNYTLFDDLLARWHAPQELMTPKEKEYLSEEIVVSNDNFSELSGEIGMYKDLLAGKISMGNVAQDHIDDRLVIMFPHLKPEYLRQLKQRILAEE
jgi:hypothetical protein